MRVVLHRNFVKRYKKLRTAEQKKFRERRNLFMSNPFHPLLSNHPLQGKYEGYRSFNVTGDLRVVYRNLNEEVAVFVEIGTHNELYS